MANIYAIGGGNALNNEILTIDNVLFKDLTNPKVLYIPAASNDSEKNINDFINHYSKFTNNIEVLCLTSNKYNLTELKDKIFSADILYVGGGRTELLVKLFEYNQVDLLLAEYLKTDKTYVGISAGGIILFDYGYGDAESYIYNGQTFGYKLTKGLGFINGVFCPHYFSEGIMEFNEAIKDTNLTGYAVTNGACLHIIDGNISVIKEKGANAFVLKKENNYILEVLK